MANNETVAELRNVLVYGARNASLADTTHAVYPLAELDAAIQGILNHFIGETMCTKQADDIAIQEGDYQFDFGGFDGFSAERLRSLFIDGQVPIGKVDLDVIIEKRRCQPSVTGSPQLIGFDTPTSVWFWPTADADYTINFGWSPPLTPWTAGADNVDNLILNVPGYMAATVVRTGGVVWLQSGQIENVPLTNPKAAEYAAYVRSCKGKNGMGSKIVTRRPASAYRAGYTPPWSDYTDRQIYGPW